MLEYEEIEPYVFVTKLAGFEHTEYIQPNATHEPKSDSDIPMVQGKNIRNGKFVDKYDWYIAKEISDSLPRSTLKKDCILIPYVGSNLGEVGVFYHTKDCHLASNVAKIELTSNSYDIEYLKYYLQSPIGQSYLFQTKQGSAQPNITMDSIRKTKVIKRDLPTQKKIADVLSCIDDKIALNNKTNSELENMAKTVYDYWFTQFDFPDANGNPYKTSGGKMEYNQVLKREIPAGWEVKSLDYFGEFKNGINYDPEEIGDTTVKIINVRNITESTVFFNISNFDALTLKGKEVQKYLTDNNDIFIARSGTPGATRLLPPDVKDVVYCGFIIRYKIFDSVNKNYAFFSVKQYENQTTLQAAGTILKNVSQDTLKDIYIPVPEKEILLKFNKKIESIFNMQLKIAKENEELTKLRDYLLPLLMNGQIEVK